MDGYYLLFPQKSPRLPPPFPFFWFVLMAIILMCMVTMARAEDVNLTIIAQIESDNDTLAYNSKTKARGAFQITPQCLADFNKWNNKGLYYPNDMFDFTLCSVVADWYLNDRIPKLLKHYKIPDNVKNRLLAYHDGINNLIKYHQRKRKLSKETNSYIIKYFKLLSNAETGAYIVCPACPAIFPAEKPVWVTMVKNGAYAVCKKAERGSDCPSSFISENYFCDFLNCDKNNPILHCVDTENLFYSWKQFAPVEHWTRKEKLCPKKE